MTILLLLFSCEIYANDEPRLYSGAIEVPTLGQIETTFEPIALEALGQWLTEVTDYD